MLDRNAWLVLGGIFGLLTVATAIATTLRWTVTSPEKRQTIENLFDRTLAWWAIVALLASALALGATATLVLFAMISFLALREVVTLAHTRRGDHRTLFWAFFAVVPLQYLLIHAQWYGMFVVMIPVWVFLMLAIRSAVSGDVTRYHERTARVFWALMICVFCLSHAPALLMLGGPRLAGYGANLLLFLLVVVQLSDVMQYVWGKLLGRRKVVPGLSPSKTWEGLIGGVATATAAGAGLWWMTPLTWWEAGVLALLICVMGFLGGLVMSAIKRDAGAKDWGSLIPGHGGVMDRVDSLAFAAPVFFHVMRYWFEG
jgi:phosphatidate cytidylyltransferase